MSAGAGEIQRKAKKAEDVWYCVQHELPAAAGEPPSCDGETKGLVFHHWVEPPGSPNGSATSRLLSYWSSAGAFAANRAPFQRRMQVGEPAAQGYVREFKIERPPLWKRVNIYQAALWIAAFYGAWTAMVPLWDWLFAPPRLELALDSQEPLHGVVGEPFRRTLTLKNDARRGIEVVSTQAALVRRTAPRRRTPLVLGPIDRIANGETSSVLLRGSFPGEEALYDLEIEVAGTAGRLREQRSFPLRQPVRVWLPRAVVPFSLAAEGLRATVRGRVLLGTHASRGLNCAALLVTEPRIRFARVPLDFPGVETWPDPVSGPGINQLKWRTDPLPQFKEVPFTILLEANGAIDWNQVEKEHVQIDCAPHEEGL